MRKIMMIINPNAGKGAYSRELAPALKMLSDADCAVTLFFTRGKADATRLAAEHGGEFDHLICLGGDGTLSEVAAGLMAIDERPSLGYFPLGTANDVARTLGIPKNDLCASAERFLSGTPTPFDIGRHDSGYFNYVAAFGAFTEVSYGTPQEAKQRFGEAAYLVGAAKSLPHLKSRHVIIEHDGGVIDGEYLYGSVSNSRSVAGLVDLPNGLVDLADGVHELILVKQPPSAAKLASLAAQVLSKNLDSEYIEILHTKKARFLFDEPTSWTFDGEDGGEHTLIAFENIHRAIEFIC